MAYAGGAARGVEHEGPGCAAMGPRGPPEVRGRARAARGGGVARLLRAAAAVPAARLGQLGRASGVRAASALETYDFDDLLIVRR
eukprot:276219-Prorocentrum_minimum.AAC.2